MKKNARKRELLLVGGSTVVSATNGAWTTKSPVAEYLNELALHFDRVIWATTEYKGNAKLGGTLDPAIKVIPLRSGRFGIVKNSILFLVKFGMRRPYILVYFPAAMLVLGAIPLLIWRSKRFATYLAGDYRVSRSVHTAKKGVLWQFVFTRTIVSLMRCSDVVIARGSLLRNHAKHHNKKVVETVPIGHLPKKMFKDRRFNAKAEKRIIFIGKLLKTKGVMLLLESFRNLVVKNSETRLHLEIVGDGDLRGELEEYIKRESLQKFVTLHGWIDKQEELEKVMALADVLVVPSTSKQPEGVPRVIEEALMRGIPVISTMAGGIAGEFCKDEIYLVAPDSVDELQVALNDMLFDKSIWEHYRKYCQIRLEKWKKLGTPGRQHSEVLLGKIQHVESD